MGNRAKRVKLARMLKERGLGRLYPVGKKRDFWRKMSARYLKRYVKYLSRSVGELVHDCDGFNHYIKDYDRNCIEQGVMPDQYEFNDGRWSCGCSPIDDPLSREEIEEGTVWYYDQNPEELNKATEQQKSVHQLLKSGGHICDENGLKLENG